MNNAIKIAIEKGGYNHPNLKVVENELYAFGGRFHPLELENGMFLDPLFWQALGKALGWKKMMMWKWSYQHEQAEDGSRKIAEWGGCSEETYHAWRYLYLTLTGGDTEKFWKDLLKVK